MRRLSESASTLAPRRSTLGLCAWLLVPFTFGCDGCVSEDFSPQGAIEPAVLDLGPVLGGESCEAGLTITNRGGSELPVDGAELRDSSGDYALPAVIVNSVRAISSVATPAMIPVSPSRVRPSGSAGSITHRCPGPQETLGMFTTAVTRPT